MLTPVSKYLNSHAAPHTTEATATVTDHYTCALVLPAFDEPVGFLDKLMPADARDVLVILLVNAPDNLPDDCPSVQRSLALLNSLSSSANCPEVVSYDPARHIDVLVIDLVSAQHRLPSRKGVGAVRKLGADICLDLIHKQQVQAPWIYCTDADVRLPNGYFGVADKLTTNTVNLSAVVLPYRHFVQSTEFSQGSCAADQTIRETEAASELYELHMRYFVNRLTWCGSPYAYPALGSLMVVSATHYAMVRGFPGRPAAEDFYLLNKLAKIGCIACPTFPLVQIQARYSTRVPFGTGPALLKIAQSGERLTYAPESFAILRLFYYELGQMKVLPKTMDEIWSGNFHNTAKSEMLLKVLDKIGFPQFIELQLRECKTLERLTRSIHEWFDAFRTIKFLHVSRAFGQKDVPVLSALSKITQMTESTALDYLAFLTNADQSGTQYSGLGRSSWNCEPPNYDAKPQ